MDISQHKFVSKHIKLDEKKAEEILKRYNISKKQLPKIRAKDPAVKSLEAKPGDIIKIIRKSPTAKKAVFYRTVINA